MEAASAPTRGATAIQSLKAASTKMCALRRSVVVLSVGVGVGHGATTRVPWMGFSLSDFHRLIERRQTRVPAEANTSTTKNHLSSCQLSDSTPFSFLTTYLPSKRALKPPYHDSTTYSDSTTRNRYQTGPGKEPTWSTTQRRVAGRISTQKAQNVRTSACGYPDENPRTA